MFCSILFYIFEMKTFLNDVDFNLSFLNINFMCIVLFYTHIF